MCYETGRERGVLGKQKSSCYTHLSFKSFSDINQPPLQSLNVVQG